MQLNSASNVAVASNGSSAPAKKSDLVSTDAFMQLLVAQLKNQDPTKPVDSAQYVSQLASLSGLEQTVKQTAALDRLASLAAGSEAGSVLGLQARSADGATIGIVQFTRVGPDGITMVLDSGHELLLGEGVSLSLP